MTFFHCSCAIVWLVSLRIYASLLLFEPTSGNFLANNLKKSVSSPAAQYGSVSTQLKSGEKGQGKLGANESNFFGNLEKFKLSFWVQSISILMHTHFNAHFLSKSCSKKFR